MSAACREGGLILVVVLGAVMVAGRANLYVEAAAMLANGVATEATVVEKKHWLERGRRGREYDRYAMVYQFADGSGTPVMKEIPIGEDDYDQTSEGGPIDIIYKASAPGTNDARRQYERSASIANSIRDILLLMAIIAGAAYVVGFLVSSKLKEEDGGTAWRQTSFGLCWRRAMTCALVSVSVRIR